MPYMECLGSDNLLEKLMPTNTANIGPLCPYTSSDFFLVESMNWFKGRSAATPCVYPKMLVIYLGRQGVSNGGVGPESFGEGSGLSNPQVLRDQGLFGASGYCRFSLKTSFKHIPGLGRLRWHSFSIPGRSPLGVVKSSGLIHDP